MNKYWFSLLFVIAFIVTIQAQIEEVETTTVEVSAQKQKTKKGILGKKKRTRELPMLKNASKFSPKNEYAVWIPNSGSYKGTIRALNIYVTHNSCEQSLLYLKLYQSDSLIVKPAQLLWRDSFLVPGGKNGWIQISFENHPIPIPPMGFFVGINKDSSYQDCHVWDNTEREEKIKKLGRYGAEVGIYFEKVPLSREKNWFRDKITGESWHLWPPKDTLSIRRDTFKKINPNNDYLMVPAVYADIEYTKREKTALKQVKNIPAIRSNTKKPDYYEYPQNSPKALFNSIAKAFEQENIAYILRYLCRFDEEDQQKLKDLLATNSVQDLLTKAEIKRLIQEYKDLAKKVTSEHLKPLGNHKYVVKGENYIEPIIFLEGKWFSYNGYDILIDQIIAD